jgi:hypothetical protein
MFDALATQHVEGMNVSPSIPFVVVNGICSTWHVICSIQAALLNASVPRLVDVDPPFPGQKHIPTASGLQTAAPFAAQGIDTFPSAMIMNRICHEGQ